jgi:hypothetical protein
MKHIFRLLLLLPLFSAAQDLSFGINGSNITLSGRFVDEYNHPLSYVGIYVPKTQQGSYTDDDGKFDITKIGGAGVGQRDSIYFTHIGYEEWRTTAENLLTTNRNQLTLTPKKYDLKEVTVKPGDTRDMLRNAVARVKQNYPSTFSNSEIVFKDYSKRSGDRTHYYFFHYNLFLPGYSLADSDKVYNKVLAHEMFVKKGQMFMPEIKPGQLIQLMFPEKVFSEKELKENEYKFLGTENIDGEEMNVIEFKSIPKKKNEAIAATGKAYIQTKDQAIRFIEFHIFNERAKRFMLVAKMESLNVNVKVAYKPLGGKYVLDYISQTTYATGSLFGKSEDMSFSTTAKVLTTKLDVPASEIPQKNEIKDIFKNEKPKPIEEMKAEPDMR